MRARGAPDARARGAPPCPAPFSCATPLFPFAAPPARVHAACVLAARRAIEHDARAGRPRRARARRPLCPHPSSLALTWCVSAHARHALIRLRGAPCTSARCVRARSAPSITSSRARRAPEARAFGAPPVPPPLLLACAHLVRHCAPAPRPEFCARRPLRECARRTCSQRADITRAPGAPPVPPTLLACTHHVRPCMRMRTASLSLVRRASSASVLGACIAQAPHECTAHGAPYHMHARRPQCHPSSLTSLAHARRASFSRPPLFPSPPTPIPFAPFDPPPCPSPPSTRPFLPPPFSLSLHAPFCPPPDQRWHHGARACTTRRTLCPRAPRGPNTKAHKR